MPEQYDIIKKRFIAGAVCPSCDVVDRIVVEVAHVGGHQPELSRRRCVDCGFADPFGEENTAATGLGVPKGRPERPRNTAVNSVQVRILDPKDPSL